MISDCPRCGKVCTFHAPSRHFYCGPCEHHYYTASDKNDALVQPVSTFVLHWWEPTRLSYTRPAHGVRFNGTWTMEEDVQRLRHLLPRITDKILCGPTDGPWPVIKAAINLEATERELEERR